MRNSTASRVRVSAALARIRLTASERLAAEDGMEKGELIAEFILGAIAVVRYVLHGVERGLRALAGRKSMN